MAKVDVLDWKSKKVGEVELSSTVFEGTVRQDLLQAVVNWQLASRRQGTHHTKTRGEVSGGGKKPFKQKGTGNARQGSIRSPLQPGGGITFGPKPRSYEFKLNKKFKKAALRSAFSYLFRQGRVFVVDTMESSEGKTNELAQRLKSFGVKKAVLIDGESNQMFARACRNMPNFRYYPVAGVNVFDLLKFDAVVLSKSSVDGVHTWCGGRD